jgi:hypothetical protein
MVVPVGILSPTMGDGCEIRDGEVCPWGWGAVFITEESACRPVISVMQKFCEHRKDTPIRDASPMTCDVRRPCQTD